MIMARVRYSRPPTWVDAIQFLFWFVLSFVVVIFIHALDWKRILLWPL
jgi:uncharacterized membrane protein